LKRLLEQPLNIKKDERVNKALFYSLFNKNLDKILHVKNQPSETEIKAAKDILSLCRAAVGVLAGKGDLRTVHDVIDNFGPWSSRIVEIAKTAKSRKHRDTQDPCSYNILCLPEEDENAVNEMLKVIVSLAPFLENAKAMWQEFRDTDRWESGVIIGDGGIGSELIRRGPPPVPVAWWNMERGKLIQQLHEEHIAAGAQVILTNTIDANRMALRRYDDDKYAESVEELNKRGVEIALRACAGADGLVLGRIGPSRCDQELFDSDGNGAATKKELYDAFREQAETLCEAGVEGIWIEGMTYLKEAVIATKAASENTKVPVMCTMQFDPMEHDSGCSAFRTINRGDRVSNVVNELNEAGAKAIGADCGNVVEDMPHLALEMRENTDLPLVFRVCAGHPQYVCRDGKPEAIYNRSPDEFAEIMLQVAAAGGNIVAGCCGVTPEHVAALRAILEGR